MTMIKSDGWIVMRTRVSLAGRVTAGDGGTANGGTLSLTTARRADHGKAKSPSGSIVRQYDTRILGDGFYFFLDLPTGTYVLSGEDERGNEIEAQQVSIPPAKERGPLDVVALALRASTKPGVEEETTAGTAEQVTGSKAPARRRRGSRSASAGDRHT